MGDEKKFILGQYFTKPQVVNRLVELLLSYKDYKHSIKILEPSFGTGNFVEALKTKGFISISGCEIDPQLTAKPCDFFDLSLEEKFDLIIGNPPFTKYNVKESYYYTEKCEGSKVSPQEYLTPTLIKRGRTQVENAFILKSIKHLKDQDSSIGFVLPISFFIKGKNTEIKKEILRNFSTIIVYQNDKQWFDEQIPCCFAIFTNIKQFKGKTLLLYENEENVEEMLDIQSLLNEELIPRSFLFKKQTVQTGTSLSNYLVEKPIKFRKSFTENNVSGSNILERNRIPEDKNVSDYYLAVVRVGNGSVGKAGLINIKEDILNDMFYVFAFKSEYQNNKQIKEDICLLINKNIEYFRNITFRVGSKSIKKTDLLDFRVNL